MNIEPISDLQYVREKLQSNIFSIKPIIESTEISRYQIRRVIDGLPVKAYVIIALNDYFRKLSE